VTEAQQRRTFFEKQLEQTKANLVKAELALRASGVSSGTLKSNPAAAVAGLAGLKAALTAQEIKLANMRGYLTESAPAFKQAQNELLVIRQQIDKAEAQEAPGTLNASGANPASGAQGQGDYIARYRDYKYHETLLELFAKQYEVARIDESREGAVIQVVDAAQPPDRKSKPKKALTAIIATLAAGFALLLWVFLKKAWVNAQNDTQTSQKMTKLKESLRGAWGRK
jgi:capsule polysaccharide export protein KpsE/RkpR